MGAAGMAMASSAASYTIVGEGWAGAAARADDSRGAVVLGEERSVASGHGDVVSWLSRAIHAATLRVIGDLPLVIIGVAVVVCAAWLARRVRADRRCKRRRCPGPVRTCREWFRVVLWPPGWFFAASR